MVARGEVYEGDVPVDEAKRPRGSARLPLDQTRSLKNSLSVVTTGMCL